MRGRTYNARGPPCLAGPVTNATGPLMVQARLPARHLERSAPSGGSVVRVPGQAFGVNCRELHKALDR